MRSAFQPFTVPDFYLNVRNAVRFRNIQYMSRTIWQACIITFTLQKQKINYKIRYFHSLKDELHLKFAGGHEEKCIPSNNSNFFLFIIFKNCLTFFSSKIKKMKINGNHRILSFLKLNNLYEDFLQKFPIFLIILLEYCWSERMLNWM